MPPRILRALALLALPALLGGCNVVLMQPSGHVAVQQRDLIIASTGLMLLIILPVMALTLLFAWRYRATNTDAVYDPEWHHSTRLEVVIWAAPLAIIIALGALTWISTHTLDPFRPLQRLDAEREVPAGVKPLVIEVVALDWKWLFFYPDSGIATVNEIAAPVDRPIQFKITSASVMNSFFIPSLAGQIYAMAGMETQLHAVINQAGVYDGFSANYSGAGFSRMHFKFHGLDQAGFDGWIAKAKAEGKPLDRPTFLRLEEPTEQEPVRYFGSVENGLYEAVLNMCAQPGKMCANEMMHIDAMGGAGKESEANRERLEYDNRRVQQGIESPGATFPASGRSSHDQEQPEGLKPKSNAPDVKQPNTAPQQHQGHDMPGMPGMKQDGPAPAQLIK
jgi:cytochrome o ubiquinol oxidase subunit 2